MRAWKKGRTYHPTLQRFEKDTLVLSQPIVIYLVLCAYLNYITHITSHDTMMHIKAGIQDHTMRKITPIGSQPLQGSTSYLQNLVNVQNLSWEEEKY